MNKVIIIGCGKVGITYAYSLINTKMNIDEIVLIDKNKDKIIGDYLDLSHSILFSENNNINIKIGDYKDIEGASIICITAGAPQGKNKSRLEDIEETKNIFIEITNEIKKYNFNGIFLIASNPNDVMCYAIHKYLSYDPYKIIGSGISLDTARLIDIISKETNLDKDKIKGYVLGEHGESAFVVWSNTYINNEIALQKYKNIDKKRILDKVHNASKEIVKSKLATYYGVSTTLCKITKCILNNIEYTMPLSAFDKDNNIYIGNICTINKNGIKSINKLNLNKEEMDNYNKSASIIKEYTNKLQYIDKY